MYPFTNPSGKMKVSQAMPLMNFISNEWNLNLVCLPSEQKMFSWGHGSFRITNRILKHSERNN